MAHDRSIEMSQLNDERLTIRFVLKRSGRAGLEDGSDELRCAFQCFYEHFDKTPTQEPHFLLSEEQVMAMDPITITRKSVFLMDEFEGECFDFLCSTRATILGPRCFTVCLRNNYALPMGNSPIYTVGMRGVHMSTTGLSPEMRARMKRLVEYMGGIFYSDLNGACTHLVAQTIKSNKYEQAAMIGLKIYLPDWVEAVWEESKRSAVEGTYPEFERFRLPIFYKLIITTTGLNGRQREEIKSLVEKNGGTYTGAFKSDKTDILILEQSGTDSAKYQNAVKFKKDCLTPDWIRVSAEKGYAVPVEAYRVTTIRCSTPTHNEPSVPNFLGNTTQMSAISHLVSGKEIDIEESMRSRASVLPTPNLPTPPVLPVDPVDRLNMSEVRAAKTFLDGCKIYLCGFTTAQKERINRVLNSGGATWYDEADENVQYVIVGEPSVSELNALREKKLGAYMVTFDWLLESIRKKEPIDTDNFMFREYIATTSKEPEMPSPASKRNLEMMQHSFKRPPPKFNLDGTQKSVLPTPVADEDKENEIEDILSQYAENFQAEELAQPLQPPEKTSATNPTIDQIERTHREAMVKAPRQAKSTPQSSTSMNTCGFDTEQLQSMNFLEKCHVFVLFNDKEEEENVIEECRTAKGIVVAETYKEEVDFIITPLSGLTEINTPIKAREIVSELWMEACFQVNNRVNIEYYFRPIIFDLERPIFTSNEIFVISIYTSQERMFLSALAEAMGGKIEMTYAKKTNPILICPQPEGAKYEASIKWGLPAVTKDWLLACYDQKRKVPLDGFLCGEEANNIIPNSQPIDSTPPAPPKQTQEPSSKEDSFVLKHRRISELRNNPSPAQRGAKRTSDSPDTPRVTAANISDLVQEFPTPHRVILKAAFIEMEDQETPEAKRLKRLLATPGARDSNDSPRIPEIPEVVKTPSSAYGFREDASPANRLMHKHKMDVICDPEGKKKQQQRRQSTPLSEIRQKFWKDALGDLGAEQAEGSQSGALLDTSKDRSMERAEEELPLGKKQKFDRLIDQYTPKTTRPSTNVRSLASIPSKTIDPCASSTPVPAPVKAAASKKSTTATSASIKQPSTQDILQFEDFVTNRRSLESNSGNPPIVVDTQDVVCRQDSEAVHPKGPEIVWRHSNDSSQNDNENHVSSPIPPVRHFLFSSLSDQDRVELCTTLESMPDNILSNTSQWDPQCTHVILEKPNRSEKVLAGIATGRWLLHFAYITDSANENRWLDEELYEFGNPRALPKLGMHKLENNDQEIAAAAHRQRVRHVQEPSFKLFQNIRCILLCRSRPEQFRRLIEAAGGTVIDAQPSFFVNRTALEPIGSVTHCFIEPKNKLELSPLDVRTLRGNRVEIIAMPYLSHCIIDSAPTTRKYTIQYDYKYVNMQGPWAKHPENNGIYEHEAHQKFIASLGKDVLNQS